MTEQQQLNYYRIAEAIEYIKSNFKKQPTLDEIASKVYLSPFHFQRLFREWAGTTPKQFLQYISVEHAKQLLKEQHSTLFDTTHQTGLSSTSRLHDLFIKIEGMTPAEFKNGGENLSMNYSFNDTVFGKIIVASTIKGICYMAFNDSELKALNDLKHKFPNALLQEKKDTLQENALLFFQKKWDSLSEIKLHLKGTDFQLKVWETLLKIPLGKLSTYGTIAEKINSPKASRAVGTAIGNNPVAFLIPCHRVIQATGNLGGYMWGETRKSVMIGWESAAVDTKKT